MRYRKNWEAERRGCFGAIAQPENALTIAVPIPARDGFAFTAQNRMACEPALDPSRRARTGRDGTKLGAGKPSSSDYAPIPYVRFARGFACCGPAQRRLTCRSQHVSAPAKTIYGLYYWHMTGMNCYEGWRLIRYNALGHLRQWGTMGSISQGRRCL